MPADVRKRRVWVVMHYEIMFGSHIDCLQFHVSSSRREAEKYVARNKVVPWSWWQIHPYIVDDNPCLHSEGEEVHYYSHTGKHLKAWQFAKAQQACILAYKRQKKAGAKGSW